jgi:hypothetical protein
MGIVFNLGRAVRFGLSDFDGNLTPDTGGSPEDTHRLVNNAFLEALAGEFPRRRCASPCQGTQDAARGVHENLRAAGTETNEGRAPARRGHRGNVGALSRRERKFARLFFSE